MNKIIKTLLLAAIMLVCAGCGEIVPPGKTVIVMKPDGATTIHDKGYYTVVGRDVAFYVDGKLSSYTEKLQILCTDEINMDVDVKTVLSFQVDTTSVGFLINKVPTKKVDNKNEMSIADFYTMVIRDIVRNTARNVVGKYNTNDIRNERENIEAKIGTIVLERIKQLNMPVKISAVMLSNLDHPASIKLLREEIKHAQLQDELKAAKAKADIIDAARQVTVITELNKVRVLKATSQARENQILADSLTPAFVKWRQLEVMEETTIALAKGESNTIFVLPYEAMGQSTMNQAVQLQATKEIVETKK